MKATVFAFTFAAAITAIADPSVSIDSVSRDATNGAITLKYTLSDEDAIVTLAAEVYTNSAWQALPTRAVNRVIGDVNRLVTAGAESRMIVWQPSLDGTDMDGDGKIRVRLTLWSPAQPPNYMSVHIRDNKDVRYYVDEDALPYPPTHTNWMMTEMLFRKIPAQGVKWKMASISENRIVQLNHDYYMAIYPFTRGHYYFIRDWNLNHWGVSAGYFSDPDRERESPCPPFSYNSARGVDTGVAVYEPTADSFLTAWVNANVAVSCDLPTEAEWEYACRAGTWTPLYTGKDNSASNVAEVAWYSGNSNNQLHPVGEKLPNPWGLYEMYGNIVDWCRDFYAESNDEYFEATSFAKPAIDPTGPAENRVVIEKGDYTRVHRGGCHYHGASDIHSGYRSGYASSHTDDKAFGIRLSCTISGTAFASPTDRYADLDTSVVDGNWDCTGHVQPGLIVATAELDGVDLRGKVEMQSDGIGFDSSWFVRTPSAGKCRWNEGLLLILR